MHYLIDGHNLIGKTADIDLDDPDDEVELILRLRSWSARGRKRKVTVIFDRGLPGGEEKGLSTGQVKVIFASAGRSADSLLIRRINAAKNPAEYTLVSSDLRIIRAAEVRHMPVRRSEIFAARMIQEQAQGKERSATENNDAPQLGVDEVEMWLDLFNTERGDKQG